MATGCEDTCPALWDRHWGEVTAGHPWGSMGQQGYGTETPGWLWGQCHHGHLPQPSWLALGASATMATSPTPPEWFWVALPPESPLWALTRDGDRGVAVLLQHGVEHQARVGDTGLHQHVQDAVHLEEPLLVGHL